MKNGIMDYSLLLAIEKFDKTTLSKDAEPNNFAINGEEETHVGVQRQDTFF